MHQKKIAYLIIIAIAVILFLSCNNTKTEQPAEILPEIIEYPIGYIDPYISINLNDTKALYPLQEDLLQQFLEKHTQYEGVHPTISSEFPLQWGVVLIEHLPEGRELYQIQSQNREWIFLVITSGFGTERILDILPVAVNLAQQTKDVLETEVWTTERDNDGTFSVAKRYEWVRSVENITQNEYDANPEAFIKTKSFTDKYIINDMCRFEKLVVEDIPEYSAVIFYYKNTKPENWDEIAPILQSYCEENELLFEEVTQKYNQVSLYDYKFNFIADFDISPYTDLPAGLIFMKKGEMPKSVPFGNFERMKIELRRYFKITMNDERGTVNAGRGG